MQRPLALVSLACLALLPPRAAAAPIDNITGLPAYPNLASADMDQYYRVEALGRWCARFMSTSSDSLPTVEAWYRRHLRGASETDLWNDARYRGLGSLSGIKLAMGVDYVAVYRLANQTTVIELHRCQWN